MSRSIRVGVVGAGGNTRQRHIPGLMAIDGVEVVAVCNRSLASSQRVCDEFGIAKAAAQPAEIFADDSVDAVVIGTWPDQHAPLTLAALAACKHVMCEARMATDADAAQAMLHAAQRRPDLVAQVVPSPFTLTLDAAIQRCVEDCMGKLQAVRIDHYAGVIAERPRPATWRLRRCYSGNNIMGVGIWVEAMMRWVGPVAELAAQMRIEITHGVDPESGATVDLDVPDHVEAVGRLANGATWSMTASSIVAADPTDPSAPLQRVVLTGEAGTLVIHAGAAVFHDRDGHAEELAPDESAGWRVEDEFIDSIRTGAPIRLTDFATGLAYMKFTDALHESHRLGRSIRLS